MSTNEAKLILDAIQDLKGDVTEVKTGVGEFKNDFAELKEDVAVLKEDVAELKAKVEKNTENIASIKVTQENEMQQSIKVVAEGHTRLAARLDEESKMLQDLVVYKLRQLKAEHDIRLIKEALNITA